MASEAMFRFQKASVMRTGTGKNTKIKVSKSQPWPVFTKAGSEQYLLVVYDPAGPHEAFSGPLELQHRQIRVSH